MPHYYHRLQKFGIELSILTSQIDYAGGVKFGFTIAEAEGDEDSITQNKNLFDGTQCSCGGIRLCGSNLLANFLVNLHRKFGN